FQMGPLFMGIAQTCLAVNCTPVLAHHFRLTRADPYGEPQLEDLAYAGVQEFARQWLLVSRRERYEVGTGSHKLWLSAGGSSGHSGLWALDIEEGVIDDDFRGRSWDVQLTPATDARQSASRLKEEAKKQVKSQQERDDETAVLKTLDQLDP